MPIKVGGTYTLTVEPWDCEGKKLGKLEYLESEKSFLEEIKTFSIIIKERAIIWRKNNNLTKNSGHKL